MRQLKSTSKPRKRTLSIDVVVWRPADGKNSNCCAPDTLVVKAARLRLSERSRRRTFVPTSHEVDFSDSNWSCTQTCARGGATASSEARLPGGVKTPLLKPSPQ